jgi:hypothetical protein
MSMARTHHRAVIATAVALALVALALLPRARFDFNPLHLKDPAAESVAVFRELASDPMSTPYAIEVVTANLEGAQALAARLETLEVVDKAVPLASFVPTEQDAKLDAIADLELVLGPAFQNPETRAPPSTEERQRALAEFAERLKRIDERAVSAEFAGAASRLVAALDRLATLPDQLGRVLSELDRNVIGDLPKRPLHCNAC